MTAEWAMDEARRRQLACYADPHDHGALTVGVGGLTGSARTYPFVPGPEQPVIDFRDLSQLGAEARTSLGMYDFDGARAIYRNFLDWLFRTFRIEEAVFRRDLVRRLRLQPGDRVLVTGCGLGEDVACVLDELGPQGTVFASDLAPEMVIGTSRALQAAGVGAAVSLSVADACHLPFGDDLFDAAFHFGGINLFDSVPQAVAEMARVVRPGGRVVFGDEGVAPWLRETEYGRMVVANNPLWATEAPLKALPACAVDASVSWVLGNCFYVVDFEKSGTGPFIDPDVPHLGRRGGTMRSRYYGQLEGVTPELKQQVAHAAAAEGVSVSDWLQRAVETALARRPT